MSKEERIKKVINDYCKNECKSLIKVCEGCPLCAIEDILDEDEPGQEGENEKI